MSHLQYSSYPGFGDFQKKNYRYSQAVRVGDRIECSGQGGWNSETGSMEDFTELHAQIDQAFANIELTLKNAGGKGWSQVYRVNSYHVPMNTEALEAMVQSYAKWMPDHQPIWTAVGVPRLGLEEMKVEIEVVAHDPEGAKQASGSK